MSFTTSWWDMEDTCEPFTCHTEQRKRPLVTTKETKKQTNSSFVFRVWEPLLSCPLPGHQPWLLHHLRRQEHWFRHEHWLQEQSRAEPSRVWGCQYQQGNAFAEVTKIKASGWLLPLPKAKYFEFLSNCFSMTVSKVSSKGWNYKMAS